jgi:hypothetical protein
MAQDVTQTEQEEAGTDTSLSDILNFEQALAQIIARLLGGYDSSNDNGGHGSAMSERSDGPYAA